MRFRPGRLETPWLAGHPGSLQVLECGRDEGATQIVNHVFSRITDAGKYCQDYVHALTQGILLQML